jgi:hypothetical protein
VDWEEAAMDWEEATAAKAKAAKVAARARRRVAEEATDWEEAKVVVDWEEEDWAEEDWEEAVTGCDARAAVSSERLHCAHLSRPPPLLHGDSWSMIPYKAGRLASRATLGERRRRRRGCRKRPLRALHCR